MSFGKRNPLPPSRTPLKARAETAATGVPRAASSAVPLQTTVPPAAMAAAFAAKSSAPQVVQPPLQKLAPSPSGEVSLTSADFVARATFMRDHLVRIAHQTVLLADKIKAGERMDTSAFGATFDPETYPISVAGFSRHFNFLRDGKLHHGVFGFQRTGDAVDPAAQLMLFELITTVLRFNSMCGSAHQEDALGVALQSATARSDIDRIIVLSGVFCSLLDNLIAGEISAKSGGKRLAPDVARQKFANALQQLRKGMLDPAKFDALAPNVNWPLSLVEAVAADHSGQLVINHVYLSSELAKPVRDTMVRAQLQANAQPKR